MKITTIYYLSFLWICFVTISTVQAQTDSLKKIKNKQLVTGTTKVKDLTFINPKVFNFGFKQCGDDIKTNFQCYNETMFPLLMRVEHPSVLEIATVDTLGANQTSDIKVRFNTRGLRLGLQSLEFTVAYKRLDNSEDSLWKSQQLFLDGYLEASEDIHFVKTKYELDTVWIGEPYTLRLELSNHSSRVMRVYSVYCYENCESNDSLPVLFKAGNQQYIDVTFIYENEKEGWFDTPLFINTNAMLDPYELRIEGRAVRRNIAVNQQKPKRKALE